MKQSEKEKAIALRKDGYSYNLIAERVSVSKSTLHNWLADIPYVPNDEVIDRIGKARAKSGEAKHQIKLESFKKAKILAEQDVKKISHRDLFMLGLALYIGEGEKNDVVGIINSDPRIVVFAIKWLNEVYGVPRESLTLAIHLYPDNDTGASLQFWSETTGIPLCQFGKTQIDRRENKKIGKRGKLKFGTAHLRVKSSGNKNHGVLLSRRIRAAMDIVLEMRD